MWPCWLPLDHDGPHERDADKFRRIEEAREADAAKPPERSEIAGAPGLEGEAVERVRALATVIGQVAEHFTLDSALQSAGYDQGCTSVARRIIAARDLSALAAAVDRLTAASPERRSDLRICRSCGLLANVRDIRDDRHHAVAGPQPDLCGPFVLPHEIAHDLRRTEAMASSWVIVAGLRAEDRDANLDLAFRAAFAPPETFDEVSPSQQLNAENDFAGRPSLDSLLAGAATREDGPDGG